jgi:hypothetical protein
MHEVCESLRRVVPHRVSALPAVLRKRVSLQVPYFEDKQTNLFDNSMVE